MYTVSQTFNWNRFTATLRKEILENRRVVLFSVIGIYAILTVVMVLGNVINHTPMGVASVMIKHDPESMVLLFLVFFVMGVPSMAFKNLTSRAGRTSMFMSPSSTLEKFIVNVLLYIVGMFVVFFAAAQLADLTRIVALKPFEGDDFVVPGPINFLKMFYLGNEDAPENIQELQFWMGNTTLLTIIVNAALYLLGSVLWPRFSFLKTFVTLFVIQIVAFVLFAYLVSTFDTSGDFKRWIKENMSNGNLFRAMCAFWSIVTVAAITLSWYLFKRKDVVSLKWWK